jgi:excisionase family DNA binding protein
MDDHENPLASYVTRLVEERVTAALKAALGHGHGELVSTTEAARLASVTPTTVRRWLAAGRLTPRRAGRVLRVDRAELEALLEAGPMPRRPQRSPEELAAQVAASIAAERRRRG